MQLDKTLYDEINEYCKENNIKTRDFIHKLLKDAFLKEKYGDTPFKNVLNTKEKNVFENFTKISERPASVPSEIRVVVDEHYFDMLNKPNLPESQTSEVVLVSQTEKKQPEISKEEVKPKVKKKRTLK